MEKIVFEEDLDFDPEEQNIDPGRYWEFIVYEDSAPVDWLHKLDMTGLQVAISPYHDKDVIEGSNDLKKPHWHVLVCWNNKTTFKHACSFKKMLNCPYPRRKDNIKGAWEYHTHKNHADKFQYSDKDRRYLNGLTKQDIIDWTIGDKRKFKKDILIIIRNNCFKEYSSLLDYLMDIGSDELFDYASNNTILFDKYITSRRHSLKD